MKNIKILALTVLINFSFIGVASAHTVPPEPTTNQCPDDHILLGGQCYDKSSEELFERIKRAAAIQDAGPAGKCPADFWYISGKCYKGGSPQYDEVLKQASAAARAREAASEAFKPGEQLKTGKVSGEIKSYVMQVPIPCDPKLPGGCPSPATPAGYIARLYQFGLMIVGLLAFGGIVFGSLKYILSAGNVTSQQDAKDQITQAILGLILLLGAFLILYTINPNLVNLRNPKLEFINIESIIEAGQLAEDLGEQRLITAKGGGDPLCVSAINAGISIGISGSFGPTGDEVGEFVKPIQEGIAKTLGGGGEKKGSTCLKCTEGATKDKAGVCQCNPPLVGYGGGCVPKSAIPKP